MIPLEKQVSSLELSQKLKELGVKQESLFYWCHKWEGSSDEDAGQDIVCYGRGYNTYTICSSFTVAELGEMLPDRVKFDDGTHLLSWLVYEKMGDVHWVKYYRHGTDTAHVEHADTEADARALCLIYLIENKLISL